MYRHYFLFSILLVLGLCLCSCNNTKVNNSVSKQNSKAASSSTQSITQSSSTLNSSSNNITSIISSKVTSSKASSSSKKPASVATQISKVISSSTGSTSSKSPSSAVVQSSSFKSSSIGVSSSKNSSSSSAQSNIDLSTYSPRQPLNPAVLSDDQQKKIIEDYAFISHVYQDQVKFKGYFGTYNGGVAIYMDDSRARAAVVGEEEIAGCQFVFAYASQPIYIYKDSTFTELGDAYNTGMISAQDVADIYYYFYYYPSCSGTLWDNFGEIFKSDYADFRSKSVSSMISIDNVTIQKYFGGYHACDAMMISDKSETFETKTVEEDIAGRHFVLQTTQPIYIYKNSDRSFTELSVAYTTGIITAKDVSDIFYFYNVTYNQ